MKLAIDDLFAALRRNYPTSHIRLLPEPAMFLRSSAGRMYTAEGMPFATQKAALDYAEAYMASLTERAAHTEGFDLDGAHPWIIGVYPGHATSSALIFIFGNIVRHGTERWVEVGVPVYEPLTF